MSETHKHTHWGERIEGRLKGVLAHGIVGDLHARAGRDLHDTLGNVLTTIEDDVIAAVRFGEFSFFLRTDSADDSGPQVLGPLRKQQSGASSGGVDEDRISGTEVRRAVGKVLRRHALEHHRRSHFVRNLFRKFE